MDERVKKYILRQTAKYFPGENMEDTVDLFFDVLEYPIEFRNLAGVGNRIGIALEKLPNAQDEESLSILLSSLNAIEQYAKKILAIIDPEKYAEIEGNKQGDSYAGFREVQEALELGLNENQKRKMRAIRNVEDHARINWDFSDLVTNTAKYLKSYLLLTKYKSEELSAILKKESSEPTTSSEDYLHGDYIKGIIRRYEEEVREGFDYIDFRWVNDESSKENDIRSLLKRITRNEAIYMKFLGEAGSGKTTILKRIEYLLAKGKEEGKNYPIPIMVPLSELTEESGIEGYISQKLYIGKKKLDSLMKKESIVLLLDGYNEILDIKTQRSVALEIDNKIRFVYTMAAMLISDRTVSRGSIPVLSDAEKYHLRTVSIEEKMEYFKSRIKNGYEPVEDVAKSNPEYFDNLDTPYKMEQFADVVNDSGEIPQNITAYYLERLMEREMNEKKEFEMRDVEDFLIIISIYLDMLDVENDSWTQSISEKELQAKFAVIGNSLLGVKTDVRRIMDLVVAMKIMTRESDGMIHFFSRDYQNYYMFKGLDDTSGIYERWAEQLL